MRPIALDALLLARAGIPDALLRPGQLLVARVVEREGAQGRLALAGALLDAELPEGVEAGQTLHLRVAEASAERLVLRLEPSGPPPGTAPPAVPLPLPGGTPAVVRAADPERERDARARTAGGGTGGGGGEHAVAVTYDSPKLGALDLRLTLRAGELTCEVAARAGAAAELAEARVGELRAALLALGVRETVRVAVVERHDPFDAYA